MMRKLTEADVKRANDLVTPHVLALCLAALSKEKGSVLQAKTQLVAAVAKELAAGRSALSTTTKGDGNE